MKTVIAGLLLAAALTAASWDGQKGDLTVITLNLSGSIFPVELAAGLPANSTEILLRSIDPSVTAFRVTITWRDDKGIDHTDKRVVDAGGVYMAMVMFYGIAVDRIVGTPVITRLRDGESN